MRDVLIVYASKHGHTARIVGRLAEALQDEGVRVTARDVASAADEIPRRYDGVIVCASVHNTKHQHDVVEWARAHSTALSAMPSAFFSVSLTAAEDTDESRETTRRMIDDFVDDTGWTPGRTEAIAGALQYLEYDAATRILIRLLMKRGGHPTDASRDYDYTDWAAVERLGREFAGMLAGASSAGRPHATHHAAHLGSDL